MTVPVTTATAERTFSVMRRVKTYLRSSMSHKRLNHTILLHCYQERIYRFFRYAKSFVSVNEHSQFITTAKFTILIAMQQQLASYVATYVAIDIGFYM